MRKIVMTWFVISILVTGGLFAYTQFLKHGAAPKAAMAPEVRMRSINPQDKSLGAPAAEATPAHSSNTEQLALTISIASSIISAAAALMQTWLTHRSLKAHS